MEQQPFFVACTPYEKIATAAYSQYLVTGTAPAESQPSPPGSFLWHVVDTDVDWVDRSPESQDSRSEI